MGKVNNPQVAQDFYLQAEASIWPWLPYTCHIRSTLAWPSLFARSASFQIMINWINPHFKIERGVSCRISRVLFVRTSKRYAAQFAPHKVSKLCDPRCVNFARGPTGLLRSPRAGDVINVLDQMERLRQGLSTAPAGSGCGAISYARNLSRAPGPALQYPRPKKAQHQQCWYAMSSRSTEGLAGNGNIRP